MTVKTLTRDEATILQNMIWFVDGLAKYGDDAKTIKIEYDAESDDFLIETKEKRKAGRTSRLRAEVVNWAWTQLERVEGYAHDRTVKVFKVSYENDLFSVECEAADSQASDDTDEPVQTEDAQAE